MATNQGWGRTRTNKEPIKYKEKSGWRKWLAAAIGVVLVYGMFKDDTKTAEPLDSTPAITQDSVLDAHGKNRKVAETMRQNDWKQFDTLTKGATRPAPLEGSMAGRSNTGKYIGNTLAGDNGGFIGPTEENHKIDQDRTHLKRTLDEKQVKHASEEGKYDIFKSTAEREQTASAPTAQQQMPVARRGGRS